MPCANMEDVDRQLEAIRKRAREGAQLLPDAPPPSLRFTPTAEQEDAVRQFAAEKSLKLVGYAGAAKTSTLELIAHSTPRRGIYLAFNKAITNEAARRLPQAHSTTNNP
jgi:hypothetical protein